MHGLSPLHPNDTEQKVYIPEGYHNGNGYVTSGSQTVTIPEGYHNGNGYVIVNAIRLDELVNITTIFESKNLTRYYYKGVEGEANAKYKFYTSNQDKFEVKYGTYITGENYGAIKIIQADSNGRAFVVWKIEKYIMEREIVQHYIDVNSIYRTYQY